MSGKASLEEVNSNLPLGIIGVLVGTLIGAALWFILYQVGIIAYIAGIAILVLLATHFFRWGYEIYNAFKAEYEITLTDAILSIPEMVFTGELLGSFIKELAIGFIPIAVGAATYVRKIRHEKNAATDGGVGL